MIIMMIFKSMSSLLSLAGSWILRARDRDRDILARLRFIMMIFKSMSSLLSLAGSFCQICL